MSSDLRNDLTRVPVTALATCGPLFLAAEGPLLVVYDGQTSNFISRYRIFKAQAIHGIVVQCLNNEHSLVIVWGGPFVRALKFPLTLASQKSTELRGVALQLSTTAKAPDWILDLAFNLVDPKDDHEERTSICAAVTAHNALLEVKVTVSSSSEFLDISINELTSSSRSILYSAHLIWHNSSQVLVAAGTAFGEIIFWSWIHQSLTDSISRIHKVFLGHEGSIFGVRISPELRPPPNRQSQRLLASCSDDRTIRLWSLADISFEEDEALRLDQTHGAKRIFHTGFTNASYDQGLSSSACLAVGWGHLSRVWNVHFLDEALSHDTIYLRSTGEDATARLWSLSQKGGLLLGDGEPVFDFKLVETAAFHIGKNIWSSDLHTSPSDPCTIITGGADSKIASHQPDVFSRRNSASTVSEYTVQDVHTMSQISSSDMGTATKGKHHKSSAKSEFIRSYAFIDSSSFLLTTNAGRLYIEWTHATLSDLHGGVISSSQFLGQYDDLSGYSTCASEPSLGVAFVAGARGTLYSYQSANAELHKLLSFEGKIASIYTARCRLESNLIVLLITVMGQKEAHLLYIDITPTTAQVLRRASVPISTLLTGSAITAMTYIKGSGSDEYVVIGFRRGTLALYKVTSDHTEHISASTLSATLYRINEQVHGKETITALAWVPSVNQPSSISSSLSGSIISVGRNGSLVVHQADLPANSIALVHDLLLPFGPNIEGLYFYQGHLIVYGFSSTKFVVYDTTAEEEILGVDAGGAHRSWAYQPGTELGGSTLVWTRASSMRIHKQHETNHNVVRPGGHGREIKAVATLPPCTSATSQLIATGAEDTDIKLFEYVDGDAFCRRTLRKHTTGIQHLQWSQDGEYLFSSGGCEEFYIWRVRPSTSESGIQVVCESAHVPESEHSDLRIMSFDVRKSDSESRYIIGMVFSDSNIKIYSYDPTAAAKWNNVANGIYFTSCLTQCVFLSPNTLLTAGTDGHAVLWPLPENLLRPHQSDPLLAVTLKWQQPARIHQSTSKTLARHILNEERTLLVSGGDDSSISLLLVSTSPSSASYACPPVIVVRAHASAVTACSVLNHEGRTYVLTSGNDQWVRLWEVIVRTEYGAGEDPLQVKRVRRVKTNVADVSSMAILENGEKAAKVMICGVGMEVLRLEW